MSPEMKTEPLHACPACHSRDYREITLGTAPLRRCAQCKLTWAPEAVDPEEIYVEGYFKGEVGDFGLDARHPEFRGFLLYVGNERLDRLERVQRAPASLLDVGCGTGETLAVAKERGWHAVGVDLVPDAVEIATTDFGLEVHNCLLEDSGLPERSFDVVMATHVLEHMADGAAFLQLLARWVRPGGHIFIEVPNWASVDRWSNRQGWFGLRPREHLGHYGPRTLARAMRNVGLEPVAVHSPSFQYHRQSLGQALHDLGLERLNGRLQRFTVEGEQRGEPARLPNRPMRKALDGLAWAADKTRTGVVVVMIARVP
jgi:2-polyprenyl-3-methyl-5-hydroxy-6-metoxy-1,4-benzoquinol methylase